MLLSLKVLVGWRYLGTPLVGVKFLLLNFLNDQKYTDKERHKYEKYGQACFMRSELHASSLRYHPKLSTLT